MRLVSTHEQFFNSIQFEDWMCVCVCTIMSSGGQASDAHWTVVMHPTVNGLGMTKVT